MIKLSRRCYKACNQKLYLKPTCTQKITSKSNLHTTTKNQSSLQDLFEAQEKSYFTPLTEIPIETHTSVMPNEVLNAFTDNNKLIIDATFGSGGHSEKLLSKYKNIKILGLDLDPASID